MKPLLISFALCMLSATAAHASEASGQIVEVRSGPYYGDKVTITISPAPANQPACSTLGVRGHYMIDTSAPGGKAWLALILSAYAAQKNVLVFGTDECIVAGGFYGESIETIAVQ